MSTSRPNMASSSRKPPRGKGAMMAKEVPANINEEYYQISQAILDSFPKYRPPLDLFRLQEATGQLLPFSKGGSRISNEQIDEMHALCREGNLFVSRVDHPVYSEHIVKQLDLVLVDRNLKDGEIADICVRAMTLRLADFLEQPVKAVFDQLYPDLMVITEYLWQDRFRTRLFMRRLFREQYSLINHSVNSLFVGLWLYFAHHGENVRRRTLDNLAIGLLLHDLGMSKIPSFILEKKAPLTPDEREKIISHPNNGMRILLKLDLVHDEISATVLQHHERLNGLGYPLKLPGSQISDLGLISAIADSFSAMIQDRPHAPALSPLEAARKLAEDNGYDRSYTKALLTAWATGAFDK